MPELDIMKIKICGLTKAKEAESLNQNQVDFAGIVLFYPKSKRNTLPDTAAEIIKALDPHIKKVAVVVSPGVREVQEIQDLGFDYIQIHGTVSEEALSAIQIPILKAFNIGDRNQYDSFRGNPKIAGYVFDAQEPGSGKTFDWKLVKQVPHDGKMLLLAGGLTPENVEAAIDCVHPDGVDVSSGVEYSDRPGKDPIKIDRFVKAVRKI